MIINQVKAAIFSVAALGLSFTANAQSNDEAAVREAAMNYLRGFYYGETELLDKALSPELKKLGWGSRRENGERSGPHHMTRERALAYEHHEELSESAHKKVIVFEVLDKVASVKVEAVWGIDYMHLAKNEGKWQIYNVIWQSWPDGKAVD